MDYSSEIELQPNGTYIGQSNTKTLVLPNKVSQGITYSENGYTIELTPSMDTVISSPIVYETETVEDGGSDVPPIEPEETEIIEPVAEPTEVEEIEPVTEPIEAENTEPVAEPAEVEEAEPVEEITERPYSLMNTNTVAEYNPNMVENIVNGIILNKPAQLQRDIFSESGREKSTILYENIYSSDVDIETVPLLHGVRQDIKINNIGRTSFSFKVDTNGLIPQNSTGYSIALVDSSGKEQMSITSEPILDESSNISMNNILDIAPYPDGTYLVTLTIDREFVANAISRGEEVYAPLSCDISDYYIYDTYVQQLFPTSNFNSAAVLIDGLFGSGNICRTYIKFLLEGDFTNINPDTITGEALFLTYYSSSYNGTTNIRPYIPDITWDNTTLTWNTAYSGGYDSSRNGVTIPSASTISGTNEQHTINLTWGTGEGLLAAFIREDIDPSLSKTLAHNRGIVLINSNESSTSGCRRFCSANASLGRPYAGITYTTAYGGAKMYQYSASGSHQNCFGYAIEKAMYIVTPEQYAKVSYANKMKTSKDILTSDTAVTYFSTVKEFIEENTSFTATRIASKTAAIDNDSYRIAMRIIHEFYYTTTDGRKNHPSDFHFLKQINTGNWAHKGNTSSSEIFYGDPDITNSSAWDTVSDDDGNVYYYDSPTVYFSLRYK